MGLLDRITAEENKKSLAVTARQNKTVLKTKIPFSIPICESLYDFSINNHIPHCALFTLVREEFVITDSIGFDAITIAKSVSSPDFWNGTLGISSEYVFFTDHMVNQFNQFFSSKTIEHLSSLRFLRITNSVIFMSADFDTEKSIPVPSFTAVPQLTKIAEQHNKQGIYPYHSGNISQSFSISKAYLLLISVRLSINAAIKDCNISSEATRTAVIQTIYVMLCRKMYRFCSLPNQFYPGTDNEMKLIFFSPSGIDETLFQFHLAHVFASILGSTAAKSVIVLLAGTASTESEILSFLNEG